MDLEMEEMFGIRDNASRRGSVGSRSDQGSASEREEDSDDDGGRNNPMEEAIEVPDPEAGPPAEAPKPIKPKRVVQNPVPKFDLARIGGPRGIPVMHKVFKNVKFRGKGHEKEDLDVILKHLEHWAYRMYPRFPFKSTVEQMEKLGVKKPVQVMMKRYRLDMFDEITENGEDNVRRGVDEENEPEPVVDVFDELLGTNFANSDQPTTVVSTPTTVVSTPTTVIPQTTAVVSEPKLRGLTAEQKERMERNKRLAAERRLARLKREQQEHGDVNTSNQDGGHLEMSGAADNIESRRGPVEGAVVGMETDYSEDSRQEGHSLSSEVTSKGIETMSKDASSAVNESNTSKVEGTCKVSFKSPEHTVDETSGKVSDSDTVGEKLLLTEEGSDNVPDKEGITGENNLEEESNKDNSVNSELIIDEACDVDGQTDVIMENDKKDDDKTKSPEKNLFTEDDVLGMLDDDM